MTAVNEQNILERVANESRSEAQSPLSITERLELISRTEEADGALTALISPLGGSVQKVVYTPSKALEPVGATDGRTFKVINKGSANVGSAVVAERACLQGTVFPANEPITVTLSAEVEKVAVNEGDVLTWETVHKGKCVDPGGVLNLVVGRTTKQATVVTAEPLKGYLAEGFVGAPPKGA